MRLEEKEIKRRANNVAESLKAFANSEKGLTLAEVKPLINDLQGFCVRFAASSMGNLKAHFNTDLEPLECNSLLFELKENGFINADTDFNAFWFLMTGAELAKPYSKPIVWLKSARLLSWFVTMFFDNPTDNPNKWVKAEKCFILKTGEHPKADTLNNGVNRVMRNKNQSIKQINELYEKFFPSIPNRSKGNYNLSKV